MAAVIAATTETAHVFPLAALFAEKPHQGLRPSSTILRPGTTLAISNTATGMPVCLYDSGTWSCCTGKERDSETGLDYFGARYFSSAQGRFTSPDPFNVLDLAKSKDTIDKFHNYLSNPQHWNHYAYVLNNPLRYTDPLGLLEYDTQILDKKVHVHIDDSLTDKRQNELKGKLDSAISNINGNAGSLTKEQTSVLGNLKSIDVDSYAKRSYSEESKGAFTLTPGYVDDSSKAYLGSAIGHDAFHMQEFKEGGIANSRGVPAEQKAFVFQLGFGQKIGLSQTEVDYLKDLIAHPEKLAAYYSSPIK